MKKIIVVRLENVLVKKFDVEKSFEMMVGRMEKKEKDVKGVMKGYEDDLGLDWRELRKKELMDRYEGEFERREIYIEGKRVLNNLLGLKKKNGSLGDMRIVVVSEIGKRKVKNMLWKNGFDEEEIEVMVGSVGMLKDCFDEMGVGEDMYGKVVVLSNSAKDILECERLGVKWNMCGWGKVEGIESSDIYGVIGLRKR